MNPIKKNISEEAILFRPMTDKDKSTVADMTKKLYAALNAPEEYITENKIAATFEQLKLQPEHLALEVFEVDKTIIGYALLFNFWYSEYGGMVLNIDELFVLPEFQNKGIASLYLENLNKRKDKYKALSLEVLPENKGAYTLYKRNGFEEKETITLHKILD